MEFTVFIVIILVFLTVIIHSLALKTIRGFLERKIFHPTIKVSAAVYILIIAHFIEVVMYAMGFYLNSEYT